MSKQENIKYICECGEHISGHHTLGECIKNLVERIEVLEDLNNIERKK